MNVMAGIAAAAALAAMAALSTQADSSGASRALASSLGSLGQAPTVDKTEAQLKRDYALAKAERHAAFMKSEAERPVPTTPFATDTGVAARKAAFDAQEAIYAHKLEDDITAAAEAVTKKEAAEKADADKKKEAAEKADADKKKAEETAASEKTEAAAAQAEAAPGQKNAFWEAVKLGLSSRFQSLKPAIELAKQTPSLLTQNYGDNMRPFISQLMYLAHNAAVYGEVNRGLWKGDIGNYNLLARWTARKKLAKERATKLYNEAKGGGRTRRRKRGGASTNEIAELVTLVLNQAAIEGGQKALAVGDAVAVLVHDFVDNTSGIPPMTPPEKNAANAAIEKQLRGVLDAFIKYQKSTKESDSEGRRLIAAGLFKTLPPKTEVNEYFLKSPRTLLGFYDEFVATVNTAHATTVKTADDDETRAKRAMWDANRAADDAAKAVNAMLDTIGSAPLDKRSGIIDSATQAVDAAIAAATAAKVVETFMRPLTDARERIESAKRDLEEGTGMAASLTDRQALPARERRLLEEGELGVPYTSEDARAAAKAKADAERTPNFYADRIAHEEEAAKAREEEAALQSKADKASDEREAKTKLVLQSIKAPLRNAANAARARLAANGAEIGSLAWQISNSRVGPVQGLAAAEAERARLAAAKAEGARLAAAERARARLAAAEAERARLAALDTTADAAVPLPLEASPPLPPSARPLAPPPGSMFGDFPPAPEPERSSLFEPKPVPVQPLTGEAAAAVAAAAAVVQAPAPPPPAQPSVEDQAKSAADAIKANISNEDSFQADLIAAFEKGGSIKEVEQKLKKTPELYDTSFRIFEGPLMYIIFRLVTDAELDDRAATLFEKTTARLKNLAKKPAELRARLAEDFEKLRISAEKAAALGRAALAAAATTAQERAAAVAERVRGAPAAALSTARYALAAPARALEAEREKKAAKLRAAIEAARAARGGGRTHRRGRRVSRKRGGATPANFATLVRMCLSHGVTDRARVQSFLVLIGLTDEARATKLLPVLNEFIAWRKRTWKEDVDYQTLSGQEASDLKPAIKTTVFREALFPGSTAAMEADAPASRYTPLGVGNINSPSTAKPTRSILKIKPLGGPEPDRNSIFEPTQPSLGPNNVLDRPEVPDGVPKPPAAAEAPAQVQNMTGVPAVLLRGNQNGTADESKDSELVPRPHSPPASEWLRDAPAQSAQEYNEEADRLFGTFNREQAVVETKLDEQKQRTNDKTEIRVDIRSISKPATPDVFDAIKRMRELINRMGSQKVKDQAEKLVGAVDTAFKGVSAIAKQPDVQAALNSAASSITPCQKRTATVAKQKAAEQEKGQEMRDEDAMIRATLGLSATAPLTRAKRAEYVKLMAEKRKAEGESRPGTAISLSDIVLGLDGAISDTEAFFEREEEPPATEQEQRDFDSLDQISTKSFDYMQVFLNAAAQLPVAAPPPPPPLAPVQAAIQEQSRATTPLGTVDNELKQKLADLQHQLQAVQKRHTGLSSTVASKAKTAEIAALKQRIEEVRREINVAATGGSRKRRKTPRRRHHRKLRKSTFRRNRKH